MSPLLLALAFVAQDPKPAEAPIPDAVPVRDRWKIPFPDYALNEPGRIYDPYRQNPLKGDYPILGQNTFVSITGRSDTTVERREVPTPSGVSSASADSEDFFRSGEQFFLNQDFAATLELFHGETSFRPRDWELRVTGVYNSTYLDVRETNVVNPNPADGVTRPDRHLALQEALAEVHLLDVSANYDFVSLKAGIQPFLSDFRGFLFADSNLGARLFGTLANNRVQWNLAVFELLEKDTNSGLNTHHLREQQVWIANVYVQDFLRLGYTAQLSVHASRDDGETHYDTNEVLVRPALLGTIREHDVDPLYLGWAGDGHIGRLNLTHVLYAATGRDEFNPIAGQETDIDAYLFALELSYDVDWARPRASILWASGDDEPADSVASGFDAILESPNFAGGPFSYWNRQTIRLQGVNLVNRLGQLPSLRTSKPQGQANFVNPGLLLVNAGLDLELLPELKVLLNANWLRFHETEVLETYLHQADVHPSLGVDLSLGLVGRPLLNNNVIVSAGLAFFLPGAGYEDVYGEDGSLYSAFLQLTLTY
jgi:hypothetical protein